MKRLNTVPAAILAVLLIACLVAFYTTRKAATRPVATPKTVARDQVVARDMALLDTADRLAALAETNDEKNQAQEAQRLADHELDQAFATALRKAFAYRVPAGPLRDLSTHIDQLKTQIATEQDRIALLTKKATDSATDQADLLNAQLALDQDELEDARQDLARQGGDPQSALERARQQHEAAQQETSAQWTALANQHNQIEKQLTSGQPGAAANTPDKIASLHHLSAQRKTLAELDQRI